MAHWLSEKIGDDTTDLIGGGLVVAATVATCTALWIIGM